MSRSLGRNVARRSRLLALSAFSKTAPGRVPAVTHRFTPATGSLVRNASGTTPVQRVVLCEANSLQPSMLAHLLQYIAKNQNMDKRHV